MKRIIIICVAVVCAVLGIYGGLSSGSGSSSQAASPAAAESSQRMLVAYFSRSGNTQKLAEIIQGKTGADIYRIDPAEPYPTDYQATVARYRQERDQHRLPALASPVPDMSGYDVIFIGYPNWGSDMPPVVQSFVKLSSLSGKTVIPFCTNGGGGFGHSVETLKSLAPGATILEGYETTGRTVDQHVQDISKWIQNLGLSAVRT